MKYIITILLALFISSNAFSQDSKLSSMQEICSKQEGLVRMMNKSLERAYKDGSKKRIEETEKVLEKHAKLYHYLDCADFRSESGRIK